MGTIGKSKFDELGNRMKEFYENRTRIKLPRRTYTLIRIDGKAFHTYTKGIERPFDAGFIEDMNSTAEYLCKKIQGAKLAFVQSDEISILMTDFDKLKTEAWFDGNVQKIVSIASSLAATKFNQLRLIRELKQITVPSIDIDDLVGLIEDKELGDFDGRTYTIPSKTEVMNYFVWRQQDTIRNSISSVAQEVIGKGDALNGKNTKVMKEMCIEKGVDWNKFSLAVKHGRIIFKQTYELDKSEVDEKYRDKNLTRTRWVTYGSPKFTEIPKFLDELIINMP